jgi:hypothetical protein
MTNKQKEILALVEKCGFVTTPYDSQVVGVTKTGAHIHLKAAKNALLKLIDGGHLVSEYNVNLMTTKYVPAKERNQNG